MQKAQKGFTILEITIVMIVIGLFIGGIMMGRELMRASDLRGLNTEINKYATAINLFRSKMGGRPGDMRNASKYWAGATDGDGDGKIEHANGLAAEEFEAWEHLSRAQLVPGNHITDFSIPESVVSGGFYRVSYKQDIYTTDGHMISLNAMNTATNTANAAVMSPKDVYSLDLKSDDGLADSGEIMGFNEEGIPGCVTNDYTAGSGTYLNSSTEIKCKIFFVLD